MKTAALRTLCFRPRPIACKRRSIPIEPLSREIPHVPLHLGVTEAGTKLQGTIKSSVGLGILLSEGIGDTMRVSLTADPVEEPPVALGNFAVAGPASPWSRDCLVPHVRPRQVNLIPIAEEITERLKNYSAPLSIAVMGCAVRPRRGF